MGCFFCGEENILTKPAYRSYATPHSCIITLLSSRNRWLTLSPLLHPWQPPTRSHSVARLPIFQHILSRATHSPYRSGHYEHEKDINIIPLWWLRMHWQSQPITITTLLKASYNNRWPKLGIFLSHVPSKNSLGLSPFGNCPCFYRNNMSRITLKLNGH